MRARGLLVCALAAAAFALPGATARAADECRGLMICISVPGPWVVVPATAAGSAYPSSSWLLTCPQGTIGGLDARLTRPEIDIGFRGLTGSPVNPGITTTNAALFTGTYTGRTKVATAFRPFIGCIPTSGGARVPTVFKPGKPTIARSRVATVQPARLARVTYGCRPGERLVSWSYAVGISGEEPPGVAALAGVRAAGTVRDGKILASASRQGVPRDRRVQLQVVAICTRVPAP